MFDKRFALLLLYLLLTLGMYLIYQRDKNQRILCEKAIAANCGPAISQVCK